MDLYWLVVLGVPVVVFVFLVPSLAYLHQHQRVSDLLWSVSAPPGRFEWLSFSRATDADWTSLGVLTINAWRPSVWRRLNPSLYIR